MEQAIRNLASAVLLQAAKDYCAGDEKRRAAILKQLRSAWMVELTSLNECNSLIVAEQLEKNHETIEPRLKWEIADMI